MNELRWLYIPGVEPTKELSKHDQKMIKLGWDAHAQLSKVRDRPDKKFNNALEADAHNWDTRELDSPDREGELIRILIQLYIRASGSSSPNLTQMNLIGDDADQISALFDEENKELWQLLLDQTKTIVELGERNCSLLVEVHDLQRDEEGKSNTTCVGLENCCDLEAKIAEAKREEGEGIREEIWKKEQQIYNWAYRIGMDEIEKRCARQVEEAKCEEREKVDGIMARGMRKEIGEDLERKLPDFSGQKREIGHPTSYWAGYHYARSLIQPLVKALREGK